MARLQYQSILSNCPNSSAKCMMESYDMNIDLPKMQGTNPTIVWKRKMQGNIHLASVKNPLRNFVQKELPSMDLSAYPDRPHECVNLSIGDPTTSLEFRTHPDNLRTIADNVGKVDGYTNMQGLDSARQAVCDKFQVPTYPLTKDDVYLCAGGSMAIWAVMMLLGQEGDNYLFPSPGFPLSPIIAKSIKLEPKIYELQADSKWQANLEQMESLIDERTKFVLVNDPSNPLGACWDSAHKQAIIELCRKHKLPLLVDEIYEGMTYDEQVPTFAELSKNEDITIFKCSGLTKRYLGPGWRMGWIILYGSAEKQAFYRPFLRGIFNVILMPNTVMQAALPQILANPVNEVRMKECLDLMRANQRALIDGLAGEDYCSFGHASGALYATILIKLEKFPHIPTTIEFTKLLYAAQNLKVFPGDFFFGRVAFIRLVISCSNNNIKDFLIRFKRFCKQQLP